MLDFTTSAALGHTIVLVGAQDATCTQSGATGDRKCSVCEEIFEHSESIAALGHDWNRTEHKCNRCGTEEPTVTINGDILHSAAATSEEFGNYTTINFNGYEYEMDRVIFGYKEDYIHSINASRVEFAAGVTYSGVEVYVVYKKNPNYGKEYGVADKNTDSVHTDERQYLVDYYVLSDSRMQYENTSNDENHWYGFAAYLGCGVEYCYMEERPGEVDAQNDGYHISGAVKEIRFENFDTSKTTSLQQMFYLSQIETIDLRGWDVSNVTNFEDMFTYCVVKTVIYPENWPDSAPKAVTDEWNP